MRSTLPHPTPRRLLAPFRPLAAAVGAALAAMTLLAGCGLIPAQPITNPLGLDGARLNVQITGSGGLSAAAVGSASAGGAVGDIATPVAPGRFAFEQPLAGTATVTVPAASELPETITLSDLALDVAVSDAQAGTSFALSPSGGATLTRSGGSSYTVSEVAFSATLTGEQLAGLNPILTGGGDNRVTATLTLTATSTPDLPPGSRIELAFGTGSGTVGF